jgi:hypothetical protein
MIGSGLYRGDSLHRGLPIDQFLGPLLIGATLVVATRREASLFIPLITIPIVPLQLNAPAHTRTTSGRAGITVSSSKTWSLGPGSHDGNR